MNIEPGLAVALAIALFFLFLVFKGIRIVPQAQVMMIERLGRFHKVAHSGLNFIFPIIDAVRPYRGDHNKMFRTIELREQVMDFPPQPVITKDNVALQVDSVIYFRIVVPERAMYEIDDLTNAIRQLAVTTMRNIMGELDLDETLTSRDTVNAKLQRVLDEATDVWGVKVTRVELKNINPPIEIEEALSRQMKAERERRALVIESEGRKAAQILRAQGERDAAIMEAEGRRQAAILDAQGRAEAHLEMAKAKAAAVRMEFDAIHSGAATPDVIAIRYLETLSQLAQGPANKIFLPYEATGILSAVAQIAEAARVDKGSLVADKVFRVHLVANNALPAGAPLVTGVGLDARVQELSEGCTGLALTVSADWARPVVELRWLVDQVIRRVRRLYDMRGAQAQLVGDVSVDLRTAIALDLRRAFPTHREGLGLDGANERFAASEDLYRRWVNEDPSVRTSIAICEDVRQLASLEHDGTLEIDILEPDRLRELGLNLLLAVGAASEVSPPRLALAKWTPPNMQQSQRPVMLLGKGITFDTGGINVKPYESFVSHMRNDMAGAALAFAAFKHLVQSGYPRPLVLAIPTCENAVGENAMRPGTVVRSHRGLRVKIDHTDAEGRLVLADGLSYAEERFAPELTFCFATLTTAALQAYGPYATPVHFATPAVERALRDASEVTGEDLHFFPSRPWHFEANRDDEADLKNTARLPGYMPHAAGSRNAAHFFLHFAKYPIVHADIFASTWNWAGDYPGTGFGATGAPLRTFIAALEALA